MTALDFPNTPTIRDLFGTSYQWDGEKWVVVNSRIIGSAEVVQFLARTSGLDATHVTAYTTLIDGLVADGVWSKFDVLRIYATQDSTTALLNLISSSFTGVTHGSPTFTADRGFTGVDTSGSVYISNGFNGTTAVSPKYVQDSAHISSWAANDVACQPPAGYANTGLSFSAYYFKYSDGNIYNRVNGTGSSDNCGNIPYNGHIICQRNGSTAGQVYRNGTSAYSGALVTSRPVQNMDFYELGDNINNSPYGSGNQYSMVSWGAALTSGEALAFFTRLSTYLGAIAVGQFLARTSGLDATHTNAYTTLINGLVADGIWGKLDVLHVYATQNSTTALLNLVSSSYPGTVVGTPAFVADRGYTGVSGSGGNYIQTSFTPSTAPSPKFVRDSAHFSVWNNTAGNTNMMPIGVNSPSKSGIHLRFSDNNTYFYINGPSSTAGAATANALSHFIANRSGASAWQGYKDGASIITGTEASIAVATFQFIALAYNDSGGPSLGDPRQIAAISIGSSLTPTEATAFYNRLRTYMTAVGVP